MIATSTRADGSPLIVPTARLSAMCAASRTSVSPAGGGPVTGRTSVAPVATVIAITPYTHPGLETASKTPAMTGPRRMLMLSIQPDTTLTDVSSSGLRAMPGVRALIVGRVTVTAVAAPAAAAYVRSAGAPERSKAAVTPIPIACATYDQKRTRPGRYPSPSTEPRGAKSIDGRSKAAATSPAAVVPPRSYA
jgi:hypothetical protein